MKENKNYRFIKKIIVAGVQFIANNWDVMASINVGDLLILVREPNNEYDENAIRIATKYSQKLGYVPRIENADIAEKMDKGVIFTGVITDLYRKELKIEVDIYEKLTIPFLDFTSFKLEIGGYFSPREICAIYARQRKFVYKKQEYFWATKTECTELIFSKEAWEHAWNQIQRVNFLAWDKEYFNPNVCDGTQWNIIIRRRNGKTLKIDGDNSYPEEWEILFKFIGECLDLHNLKGNGKFYIEENLTPNIKNKSNYLTCP